MNLLVTGSRDWRDGQIIEVMIRGLYEVIDEREEVLTLVHGAAKGADSLAASAARTTNHANEHVLRLGPINILEFPAKWDDHGKAAGVTRNQQMLDENKIDIAFAFSDDIENSKGTADMVTRLSKANIPTYLIKRVS